MESVFQPGPTEPMSLWFDPSVPDSQRTLVGDAIARSRFAWNRSGLLVKVHTVDEPPCPGHSDYMCTRSLKRYVSAEETTQYGMQEPGFGRTHVVNDVYIRTGAEDASSPFNEGVDDIQQFFIDSFIHEMGHAFCFSYILGWQVVAGDPMGGPGAAWGQVIDNPLPVADWFERDGQRGTRANWNPTDKPWEDRIQEGFAEFFKDVYVTDRWSDNRTNWWMREEAFGAFTAAIDAVVCPPDVSAA
jgi:hypothetical protein